MKTIKDRLYYLAVENNKLVRSEYEAYVNQNINEHDAKRLLHWLMLLRLNWHYRIAGKTEPLLKRPAAPAKPKTDYYRAKRIRPSVDELFAELAGGG